MKKLSVKMRAANIVNHAAGSIVECLFDESTGTLYVPSADYPPELFAGGGKPKSTKSADAEVEEEEVPAKPSKKAVKEEAPAAKKKAKGGTVFLDADELDAMSDEQLTQLLNNIGENPDDYEGKNTHKKLAELAWASEPEEGFPAVAIPEEGEAEEVEEEEEEEAPKKKTLPAKKGASKKHAEDDAEETEEAEEEEDDAPKKKVAPSKAAKKSSKKSEGEAIEDITDLEKGDKIQAYWKDYEATYKGTVVTSKNGKVNVKWEDGEEEVLSSNHEDIVRFNEE